GLSATNAGGTGTATLTLTVGQPPVITSPGTATGQVGVPFNYQITATNCPCTYSVDLMPPGLAFSTTTLGLITGTPSTAGTFNLTVSALSQPALLSGSKQVTIIIHPAVSITTPSALPSGGLGIAYPTQTFAASGGAAPYIWVVSAGSLPSGLTLSSGGVLSGTVGILNDIKTYNFTVRVTDSNNQSTTKDFALTIIPPLSFVTPSPLPTGTVGVPYSLTF